MCVAVIKAYGGDRSKNLEGIADAIDRVLTDEHQPTWPFPPGEYILTIIEARTIRGYAEQLRIIADELRCKK